MQTCSDVTQDRYYHASN